jgi:ribosomal protein S25
MTAVEFLVGRDVETSRGALRRTKRRRAQKVAERIDVAVRLVEERSCVMTSTLMRELGVGHSEAFYVLRLLQLQNRVVEVVVGNKRPRVAIWCRDGETAERLMMLIKETVHRLAVEGRMRYATPSKILQAALRDREAYELLGMFIPLSRRTARFHPVALAFIRHILQMLYGEPLKYANHKYVYIVKSEAIWTTSR